MTIVNVITSRTYLVVALTLAHSIWQGAILAGVLTLWLTLAKRSSSQTRYLFAIGVFGAMAICPLVTSIVLHRTGVGEIANLAIMEAEHVRSDSSMVMQPVSPQTLEKASNTSSLTSGIWAALKRNSRHIVLLWFVGVGLLALRGVGGLLSLGRVFSPDRLLRGPAERLPALARIMDVNRVPQLRISSNAPSALVYGVVRAVIVLPSSAILGLTAEMLDTVLAHELAHIRRHDYLVNLLQSAIETVLFYNPAVWWVSSRIREEREFCCDDMVIAALDDRITYARALEGLEHIRGRRMLVAASGGSLLTRIQRIVQKESANMNMNICDRSNGQLMAGVCALALGICMLAGIHASSGQVTAAPPLIPKAANESNSAPAAEGPGIIITLTDSRLKQRAGHEPNKALIRDTDLQRLVSELWAANAQSISIGEQRVNRETRIRAWGGDIRVDGFSPGFPIVVRAIGDPEMLRSAVNLDKGTLERLRQVDPAMVTVETSNRVELPARPPNQPKAAYIIKVRQISCVMSADGMVTEKVFASPLATTFASMPASFFIKDNLGNGDTLTFNPSPASHGRIKLAASYSRKVAGQALMAAGTPAGFTVERGKNTRILGVVSTNDSELKKAVESGKTVRGHGAYIAYYVEVIVE